MKRNLVFMKQPKWDDGNELIVVEVERERAGLENGLIEHIYYV